MAVQAAAAECLDAAITVTFQKNKCSLKTAEFLADQSASDFKKSWRKQAYSLQQMMHLGILEGV